MPANSGLLRIGYWSPGSIFDHFHGENAESLRPHAGLFPFSGDGGRRLGSILTAWRTWQFQAGLTLLQPARELREVLHQRDDDWPNLSECGAARIDVALAAVPRHQFWRALKLDYHSAEGGVRMRHASFTSDQVAYVSGPKLLHDVAVITVADVALVSVLVDELDVKL
jgi:hypothetical protein